MTSAGGNIALVNQVTPYRRDVNTTNFWHESMSGTLFVQIREYVRGSLSGTHQHRCAERFDFQSRSHERASRQQWWTGDAGRAGRHAESIS